MGLIEVLISMVLLAIGVLGAVGLQAKSLAALSNAGARVDATLAAEKLIGIMWVDQANLASYAWDSTSGATVPPRMADWKTELESLLPNATARVVVTPIAGSTSSQVSIRIGWKRRGGDDLNNHTIVATLSPTT